MKVRNGPGLEQLLGRVKDSQAKASSEGDKLVCDEKLDGVGGIVNQSTEITNGVRQLVTMRMHIILKSLLDKKGESARKAAKACKIPLSTFAGYLKPDKKQIDPIHLMTIARYYGVSIDYLIGHEVAPKYDNLPTKKLFSQWVKLTIEDLDEGLSLSVSRDRHEK